MAKSDEPINFETPEGRLINGSLFERDVYTNEKGQEGDPMYKVEMAFDWDDIDIFYEKAMEAAVREWGDSATEVDEDGDTVLAESIRDPILDGDDLAAGREKKGKKGDAYKGFAIIRANTKFNKHGEDGPGGVYVADENGEELDLAQKGKVFNGSYGIAALTAGAYELNGKGIKFYLRGFQHSREGERLRSNDVASAFKPLKQTDTSKGRKARGK